MSYHQGRVVMVTGAANGIGLATRAAFTAAGSTVVGIDRDPVPGGSEDDLRADLADEGAVVAVIAAVARRHGRIDTLVNCAGVFEPEPPSARFEPALFDRVFAINVRSMMLVVREALPLMGAGGRIVNIASELAFLGRADAPVYAASKGAIVSLTRSWARELAPAILVNAVAPGATDTPLLRWDSLSPAKREAEIAHPLRRLGRAEEVADAVLYLAGEGASFVNGQVLGVDGGAAMR